MSMINTRISLKYDTLENWEASSFILKAGEVAFATVENKNNEGSLTVHSAPTVLYKVGDGEHSFKNLKWGSALAADVYAWAKEGSIAVSKTGNGNVISNIIWDDTLNEGKGGLKVETASVATSEGMADLVEALDALTEKVNSMYTNEQIDAAIKVVADDLAGYKTTNDEALADVKATAEAAVTDDDLATTLEPYAKTADVNTELNKKQDVIAENTYDAYGSAAAVLGTAEDTAEANTVYGAKAAAAAAQADATDAKTKIDAFLDENAVSDNVINTLKEIQAELDKGEGSAADLLAEINKIKDGTTTTKANSLDENAVTQVKGIKVDNATNADKAADADKLGGQTPDYYATAASVTDITKEDGVIATAIAGANTYADGKVQELADGAVKTNTEAIAAINNEDTGILKQAKDYADGLNTAMDTRVAALEDGTSIYAVDEAETGANDVKYLVFNCGTASTLID